MEGWRKEHVQFCPLSFENLAFTSIADLSSVLKAWKHLKWPKKAADLYFAREFFKPAPVCVLGGRTGEEGI